MLNGVNTKRSKENEKNEEKEFVFTNNTLIGSHISITGNANNNSGNFRMIQYPSSTIVIAPCETTSFVVEFILRNYAPPDVLPIYYKGSNFGTVTIKTNSGRNNVFSFIIKIDVV